MGTISLLAEQSYLATTYRPDCDYIDGVLLERNVGQRDHSLIQGQLLAWFHDRRKALTVRALPEQRIKIGDSRYRIPDVCVLNLPLPDEQVFTQPPYICIEVLSPGDTLAKLQDRFEDYLKMGVPNLWVIDSTAPRAWTITAQGNFEELDGVLKTVDEIIALPVRDLFDSE